MIVTTPNKDFNKFFGMKDEQLRHWDHKYELSEGEFREWAISIGGMYGFDVEFDGTKFPQADY